MRVDSLDELVSLLAEKNLKVSDLDFDIGSAKSVDYEKSVKEESLPTETSPTGRILSLNGSPEIKVEEVKEGDNIIYVKDFESIANLSCHVGQLHLLERVIYCGICNEGENSKVNFLLEYGKDRLKKDFILKKANENQEERIVLNISE